MKIKVTIEISCRPEEVFPWIDEPDKAMLWQKGVKSGEIINETPEKIGTTFKEEIEEKGKSLVMFGEITNYKQNELISFHLESKIHSVNVIYSVAADSNESTVKAESTIRWKFPMNIICIFIGFKIKRNILLQTKSEFAELKRLCETKQDASDK